MALFTNVVSSVLVILGACDRAAPAAASTEAGTLAATASAAAAATDAAGLASSADAPPAVARRDGPMPAASPGKPPSPPPPRKTYVCPMHPEVTSETPGLCPKCNMKLEEKPKSSAVQAPAGSPRQQRMGRRGTEDAAARK
jgi:hypothetical protein